MFPFPSLYPPLHCSRPSVPIESSAFQWKVPLLLVFKQESNKHIQKPHAMFVKYRQMN